ncbi:MAG: NAD(P)/FAD-dependent oxidoreductase, partial [Methylobacter sp.]
DPALGIYKKLVVKANKLIGAVLYGDTADGSWYQELLEQEHNIAGIRDMLIFGKAYAA